MVYKNKPQALFSQLMLALTGNIPLIVLLRGEIKEN